MRLAELALAMLVGYPAYAQVEDWFPVHVEDKWVYDHHTRDDNGGGIAHLDVHDWRTEETVTGLWSVPEGTIVERDIRATGGVPPTGYRVHPQQADLLHGDCLYRNVGRDPLNHQLLSAFRNDLLAGHVAADFCFPLIVGTTWGAPYWAEWRAPADAADWEVADASGNEFHVTSTSSYPGSGMTVDIWFEKGVGIVREDEIHHGTIGEERTRLVRFDPASRR